MLTVAIPKRNKLQNIIVLTPKDGNSWRLTDNRQKCAIFPKNVKSNEQKYKKFIKSPLRILTKSVIIV